MARRLIGLDIGTNAVTVAEVRPGDPPRLEMFGQVALGRETMREGEVADDAAVTEAVGRLRAEVGLKKVSVRLGLASPRVVVRQIEMPLMSREELGSALQFQAAELIPIPLDDAVLDFAILGPASPGDGGEPRMHVLLAAVQEATVSRLVAAVEAGGLKSPRSTSCRSRSSDRSPARFPISRSSAPVRPATRRRAGRRCGRCRRHRVVRWRCHRDRGARRRRSPFRARARYRRTRADRRDRVGARPPARDRRGVEASTRRRRSRRARDPCRASIERPLSVLLDEVRSSIDYYRNQPGSSPLLRIVVTGGGAQLPGLSERLSALVGVPVEQARPRELIALGDIGFSEEELPRLDPYLPAAVGLALGGAGVGTVINLQPRARQSAMSKRRPKIASPCGRRPQPRCAVLLGGLTYMSQQSVSHAKSQRTAVQEQASKLRSQLAALAPVIGRPEPDQPLQGNFKTLLSRPMSRGRR